MLTPKAVFLLGREKMKDGPSKGQFVPVVDRAIEMEKIQREKKCGVKQKRVKR